MQRHLSRKFIVFAVFTIYAFTALIITQVVDATVVSWFGAVCTMYIGGNVVQKYIPKKE